MKKYFFFAIILVAIMAAALIFTMTADNNQSPNSAQELQAGEIATENQQSLEQLKAQLQIALQSGGMSPEAHEEIDKSIAYFEGIGTEKEKAQELREMLSQLSVGGQEDKISNNDPAVPIVNSSVVNPAPHNLIVRWEFRDGKWAANGEPPACPTQIVLQAPVNLGIVASILYPGQERGGDFKPHGGFRTDGASGPVEVRAPLEGYVWRAARFMDEAGIHYMFDIQHPCGIMYRLGHLGAVPPKFQAIADALPERGFADSRTTIVDPVFVELGETIATDTQGSTGFDWGVYDLRKENQASQIPSFREAHKEKQDQAFYAVCWLNWLPGDQQEILKSLPGGDGISGKTSDYC
ncbi:hypothetical protein HY501_02990 [Candidatus Woesearchaeota archaeon]|nr:hypothetical protein [Candidatus Woesearchaeota archaeon]